MTLGNKITQVFVLVSMERKLRARRWMRRFPSILATPTHLRSVIVAALAAVAFLLVGLFTVVGLSVKGSVDAQTAVKTILLVFLVFSCLCVCQVFQLDDCLGAYDFPDLRLLKSMGASTSGVCAVARFAARPLILELGTYALALVSAATAAGITGSDKTLVSAIATGGALLVCARSVARLGKVVFTRALSLIPAQYLGIGLLAIGSVGPLLLSLLIVALTPWALQAFERLWGAEGVVASLNQELLEIPPTSATISFLDAPGNAVWLPFLFIVAAIIAVVSILWAAPRDDYAVQLRLKQTVRWRANAAFARKAALFSLDKDSRLVIRRGYVAWKQLSHMASFLPGVAALSLIAQGVTLAVNSNFIPNYFLTSALMVCAIIAAMSFLSEFVSSFLSLDLDGKIVRFIRGQRTIEKVFLNAKVRGSATVLVGIGLIFILIAQLVAPWPGLSAAGAAVCVGLFAVTECLSIIIGSAANPALFRSEVNVPELEPTVRLTNGLLTMLVMIVGTPVTVWFTSLPGPHPALTTLLVLSIGFSAPVLSKKLSTVMSRRFLTDMNTTPSLTTP